MTRQANDGTGSHPDLGARVVPSVVAPARDGPPRIGLTPLHSRVGAADTGPALSPIASRTSSQPSVVSSPHLASRIGAKISLQEDSDCWLWKGVPRGDGYGSMRVAGRDWGAHRLAYTVMVGEIPEGLTIDHLCRQPLCVNPRHMEPVTKRENTLRGFGITAQQARRTHCPQGHPYSIENTYRNKGKRYCRTCRSWLSKPLGRQGESSPHPRSHTPSTLPSALGGYGKKTAASALNAHR